MPFMPFHILGIWFRGLLSIAILAGGIYLLSQWYQESHRVEPAPASVTTARAPAGDIRTGEERRPVPVSTTLSDRRIFRFEPGWNTPTLELAGAVALLIWASLGGWIG